MASRNNGLGQSSLVQDNFPWTFETQTHSLSSDQQFTLLKTICADTRVPFQEKRIEGYEKNIFGLQVPKLKKNAYHFGQIKRAERHTLGDKIKETVLPISAVIAFLVLLQLIKEADKKNKK